MITLPHVTTNARPMPTRMELTNRLKPTNATIGITLNPANTIM